MSEQKREQTSIAQMEGVSSKPAYCLDKQPYESFRRNWYNVKPINFSCGVASFELLNLTFCIFVSHIIEFILM